MPRSKLAESPERVSPRNFPARRPGMQAVHTNEILHRNHNDKATAGFASVHQSGLKVPSVWRRCKSQVVMTEESEPGSGMPAEQGAPEAGRSFVQVSPRDR